MAAAPVVTVAVDVPPRRRLSWAAVPRVPTSLSARKKYTDATRITVVMSGHGFHPPRILDAVPGLVAVHSYASLGRVGTPIPPCIILLPPTSFLPRLAGGPWLPRRRCPTTSAVEVPRAQRKRRGSARCPDTAGARSGDSWAPGGGGRSQERLRQRSVTADSDVTSASPEIETARKACRQDLSLHIPIKTDERIGEER